MLGRAYSHGAVSMFAVCFVEISSTFAIAQLFTEDTFFRISTERHTIYGTEYRIILAVRSSTKEEEEKLDSNDKYCFPVAVTAVATCVAATLVDSHRAQEGAALLTGVRRHQQKKQQPEQQHKDPPPHCPDFH